MNHAIHLLTLVLLYSGLASSLELAYGRAGLLSLVHAGFYGVGAYTAALLSRGMGTPLLVEFVIASATAAALGGGVALATSRLRGEAFAFATLAVQMILGAVLINWNGLTRGPLGITAIPRPQIAGWQVDSQLDFLLLTLTYSALVHLLVWRAAESPFGRALHVVREDPLWARALGKDPERLQRAAFVFSAALAAPAGVIYAHKVTYVDPTSFTILESVMILSMVILGGVGSRLGPALGAGVIVLIPEGLRFVGLPSSIAADAKQIIYGFALLVLILLRPRGLMGRYDAE